jgi:CBS domain containing-hemolysin-like protein
MDALARFMDPWGYLVLAALGIAVAATANGCETGLYRLNRIRLRVRAQRGSGAARILLDLLRDLRGMIIVCLIGYDGGTYLATVVVTTLVAGSGWVESDTGVEVLATAVLTPVFFVFTDVTPKNLFTIEADRLMYPLARPLRWAYRALKLVGVLPALRGVSTLVLRVLRGRGKREGNPFTPRERLRAVIREGVAEGVISGYQDELVGKVLGLREQPVGGVMIEMSRVAAVPVNVGRDRFLRQLRRHNFTRMPVYENHRGNVVGIVRITDVLAAGEADFDLASLMTRDVVRLKPDATVSAAMFRLRKARAPMAIVEDAHGRAAGIVTLKDLVEEIVGELAAW